MSEPPLPVSLLVTEETAGVRFLRVRAALSLKKEKKSTISTGGARETFRAHENKEEC